MGNNIQNKIKELEKKLFKIKFISPEEAIGKSFVKAICEKIKGVGTERTVLLVLFVDNTALYYDGVVYIHGDYYPKVWEGYYCDYSNKAYSYIREDGDFFEKYSLLNEDILEEILELAKKFEELKKSEYLDERINKTKIELEKLLSIKRSSNL